MNRADIIALLRRVACDHGIPGDWLVAIGEWESRLRPSAVNQAGRDGLRGGAFGLLQITLKTAKSYGYAGAGSGLLDPEVNAEVGARIMAAGRCETFDDACAWWNAGRRHASDLPADHVTLTRYIPGARAVLEKGVV